MIREASLFLLALCLTVGCATSVMTVGRDFDLLNVPKIEKGKTSQGEILSLFGQPYGKKISGVGEIWSYLYMKSTGRAASFIVVTSSEGTAYAKSLLITFDSLRVVQQVEYSVTGDPSVLDMK